MSVPSRPGDLPGHSVEVQDLTDEGFVSLELDFRNVHLPLAIGPGCEWTTIGSVPKGPGLYAFTIGEDEDLRVTYVGLTEELWMVTKGRLPSGASRPGQRYGRPLYAGVTRQRVNTLVRRQILFGRRVRHWVSSRSGATADRAELRAQLGRDEERLIRQWDLRRVGWNRG